MRAKGFHYAQKAQQAFRDKYFNMRDRDLMARVDKAFDDLTQFSRYRSRELYERNAIPFADQDPDAAPVSSAALEQGLNAIEGRLVEDQSPPR